MTSNKVLSPQGIEQIKSQSVVRLGDTAPDFKFQYTEDGKENEYLFSEYIKEKWAILFSHPRDFTPVCTTELARVIQLKDEFAKRGVRVLALSVDDATRHNDWIPDIHKAASSKADSKDLHTMGFPLIADKDKQISLKYGMLNQDHMNDEGLPFTVRSVFVIGPDLKVKLILTYPASTGRNFDEILRCIDSLQLTAKYKVATPCDWKKGDKCIVLPSVNDSEATSLFGKFEPVKSQCEKVQPYLRYVDDPSSKT